VSAKGDLRLILARLIQQQGRLIGEAGLSLDLKSGDWDNRGGLTAITSSGLLSPRGRLTSAGDLTLRAASLDNYGTLGSAEQLRLYAPPPVNGVSSQWGQSH